MSAETATDDVYKFDALQRLKEIRRTLQRQARRKLKGHEQQALETAAKLMLRAEIASLDAKSDSNDIVRLNNCARRARLDYERIAHISERKVEQRSMTDILREVEAHG